MRDQPCLGIARCFPLQGPYPGVIPVWVQDAHIHRVLHIDIQNGVDNRPPDHRVVNRENNFDAAVQVSRHQVGTAEEHLLIATIPKIKDTGVFQEPPDNTGNIDVFTQSGDPGPETADPSYLEVHPYTCV